MIILLRKVREENMEYTTRQNILPKVIELHFVTREYCNARPRSTEKVRQLMGKEISEIYSSFCDNLVGDLPRPKTEEEEERVMQVIRTAENKYLQFLGEKSADVARSALKPSPEKIKALSEDITREMKKAVDPSNLFSESGIGDNKYLTFGASLKQQEEMRERQTYAEELLAKKGKKITDLSVNDVLELIKGIDKKIEEKAKYKQTREQVTLKLVEKIVSSKEKASEEYASKYPEIVKGALADVKDSYTPEELKGIEETISSPEYLTLVKDMAKISLLSSAKQALQSYISVEMLDVCRTLDDRGGIKVDFDGGIVVNSDFLLSTLESEMKTRNITIDKLASKAMEVGVDKAFDEGMLWEVYRDIYKNPETYKEARLSELKNAMAIEMAGKILTEEGKISERDIMFSQALQKRIYKLNEEQIGNETKNIWNQQCV